MMHRSPRVLAVLVFLSCAGSVFSAFHQASIRRSRLPYATLIPEQRNLSAIPDPWTYDGLHGHYRVSFYTQPAVQLVHVLSFMFDCLSDLFDAIANRNYWAHQPYPGGRYECQRIYDFHHGPTIFALDLLKVDAPNWDFTFADIGDDLTEIFKVIQYLEHPPFGVPQMKIDVFRYRNGQGGPTFLASHGGIAFGVATTANMLLKQLRANRRPWLPSTKRRPQWHFRPRAQSTTASVASSQPFTHATPLAALTSELDRLAPRIDINADQIEILDGPEDFYETLKSKIRSAKRRIYLSTLYIGKTEHELISTVRDALFHNDPGLKVSILTDALRGTREDPDPSCASLLISLVAEFPDQIEVRMYHTPNLTGLRKVLLPKRINEGWGLQHIKLYGIDDEVILSGANLSNDYFTNRQDRYHVFRSKRVADYFDRIHSAVCSISFLLQPSDGPSKFTLEWPMSNPAPSPLETPKRHIEAATSLLLPLVKPTCSPSSPPRSTSVYPVICHPPTINTELPAFTALLARPIRSYTFTAGYFNPHPMITASLLAASSLPITASGSILTASPFANGFFGSKGISGLLPAAYTHLSLRFLQAARGKHIQLREWQRGIVGQRDGWTYHAKGLWVTLHADSQRGKASDTSNKALADSRTVSSDIAGPSVTLIGSSNYTTRSYGLDLEVGALVVTEDEGLMRKLKREEEMLMSYTSPVKEEDLETKARKAGWRVRVAMWLVKVLGGAL